MNALHLQFLESIIKGLSRLDAFHDRCAGTPLS